MVLYIEHVITEITRMVEAENRVEHVIVEITARNGGG